MNLNMAAVFAALLLAPSIVSAQNERPTLQILDFRSVEGDDDFARGLSVAVRMAAMSHDEWSVSERSVALVQVTLVHADVCSDTAPSAACYARIAEATSADILLTGIITRSSSDSENFDYIVNIDVFDARSGSIVGHLSSTFRRVQVSSNDLAIQLSGLLRELMRSVGREEQDLGAELIDPPFGEGLPPVSGEPVSRSRGNGPGVYTALGWTSLGLTIVSAAVMVGGMAHLNSLNDNASYHAYRLRVPGRVDGIALNACAEARSGNDWGASPEELMAVNDVCGQANTWETLQYVFLGTTLAFAAATAAFFAIGLTGDESLALVPSVGPEHGYVSLTGRF